MQLETPYEKEIIALLEDAQDVGMQHVVFVSRPYDFQLRPEHFVLFDRAGDAFAYLEEKAKFYEPRGPGLSYDIRYQRIEPLLEAIKEANSFTKNTFMNYNNLENLKEELSKLGFRKQVAEDMQKQMESGKSEFQLHDRVMGNKGQVDLTLHFKQSGQSENYYLNKFDVRLLNGKGLAEGEKYLVIRPNEQDPGKNIAKSFDKVEDALTYFKALHGNATLASGKDAAHKFDLARMEAGNVNYIDKDFNRTYKNPGISQTVFVERGKGFTAEQAVNLIQGRAVLRDDLIKLGGEPYKAWNKLDTDSQKDRYQNFPMLQYHVPTYGFELDKVLEKFNIKEMGDDKQREKLMQSLENGNRPLVTVLKDDKEQKLFLETSPRYSQLNFFREDGKPEKREQFLKPEFQNEVKIGQDKTQNKQQEQGMAV